MSLPRSGAAVALGPQAGDRAASAANKNSLDRNRLTSLSEVTAVQHERGLSTAERDLLTGDAHHLKLIEQTTFADRPLTAVPAHERARIVVPHDRREHGDGGRRGDDNRLRPDRRDRGDGIPAQERERVRHSPGGRGAVAKFDRPVHVLVRNRYFDAHGDNAQAERTGGSESVERLRDGKAQHGECDERRDPRGATVHHAGPPRLSSLRVSISSALTRPPGSGSINISSTR